MFHVQNTIPQNIQGHLIRLCSKIRMKHKERSKKIWIDVYGVWFEVVETNSISKSRNSKERVKLFGAYDPPSGYAALASCKGSNVAIFFNRKQLRHSDISHEIFHATHFIMELIGEDFSYNHHEPAAYLNGYLTKEVYRALGRWRVKVK